MPFKATAVPQKCCWVRWLGGPGRGLSSPSPELSDACGDTQALQFLHLSFSAEPRAQVTGHSGRLLQFSPRVVAQSGRNLEKSTGKEPSIRCSSRQQRFIEPAHIWVPGRNTKEVCVPDGAFKGLSLVKRARVKRWRKKKQDDNTRRRLIKALQGSKGQVTRPGDSKEDFTVVLDVGRLLRISCYIH